MDFTNRLADEDQLLREYMEQQFASANKEEVEHAIVRQRQAKSDKWQEQDEEPKKSGRTPSYRTVLPKMPQYYYAVSITQAEEDYFFVYTPAGISVQRVPQSQLGWGVLGVAYIGRNLIMIADHLDGLDFEEVKKHEILHILYPSLTEREIRARTRTELPFATRYN
jgi:hypothetical protein